ncbi:MAG TPA: hypothetical protein VGE67_17550 [Haloferula sp.]
MKTILLLITLALPCAAQSIFTGGIAIHSGTGDDQKSNAYEFKSPYVLQWTLKDQAPSKRDNPYWRATTDTGWKQKWVAIDVRDAATGKLVATQMLSGRENHFNVPSGGKHYIVVVGAPNIAWDVKAKEGRVVVTEKGETMEAPKPGGWAGATNQPAMTQKLAAEMAARQRQIAEAEANKSPSETTNTTPAPEVTPAPAPKPSSVPGLPAGVEPTKKADSGLPPGMMKRAK